MSGSVDMLGSDSDQVSDAVSVGTMGPLESTLMSDRSAMLLLPPLNVSAVSAVTGSLDPTLVRQGQAVGCRETGLLTGAKLTMSLMAMIIKKMKTLEQQLRGQRRLMEAMMQRQQTRKYCSMRTQLPNLRH